MPDKVLVVEDEPPMLDSLSFNLEKEGYQVFQARDGEEALSLFRKQKPDLVLLDLMLPKLSGLEVCRIARAESSIPILMLTARGDEMDRVAGLDLGADDYVVKPFGMRELLARVRALLRRTGQDLRPEERLLEVGDVLVDVDRHEVQVAGREVELSPKEFDLLYALASRAGRVLNREALLSAVWEENFYGDPRTVDVHIRWLRGKIERDASNPKYIQTVRGVGYKFVPNYS
ncbi:MAG: DNA-binding response regulator [Armatimonadetes bacterium CG_4_10_14_3_um_filter_66_18]|nr:MAG: DNA-binding response regulator [Armatimonadetes bacterium CG17_big_fil_post_rev_8_21_14_2_50_66_6]PIX37269.1 MAG: DNA-binding response regulator [Armatimonadetes bacterium CG_4_8_14_3_um_filter_66_20]PIY48079.1 MAG: DNA-binding response regulator [Armatimonadetes bacterium CG_4_10_14_3_um_filter_66_18]